MKKLMNNNEDRLFILTLFKNDMEMNNELHFQTVYYSTTGGALKQVYYYYKGIQEFIIIPSLWKWLKLNKVFEK